MSKYGLHSNVKAKSGKGKALLAILVKASQLVANLESCYLYMVSADASDPDSIFITEVWKDKKSHDESLKNPEVLNLISHGIPLIEGRPEAGIELKVEYGI
jgi:quinol monooxygenase YgiN